MTLTDHFRFIFIVLWRYKWRSMLAVLGVVWGTYVTAMLLALGQGMYVYNQQKLSQLAKPIMYVIFGQTSQPSHGLAVGRELKMPLTDIEQIPKQLYGVTKVSPIVSKVMTVQSPYKTLQVNISSATPALFQMFQASNMLGRTMISFDLAKREKVIFLSEQARTQLFPPTVNPVGQSINVGGIAFRVIGVAQDPGRYAFIWRNNYIPTTSFQFWGVHKGNGVQLELKPGVDSKAFETQVKRYFAHKLHFSPNDKQALMVWDLTGLTETFSQVFLAIRVFLGLCGVMTLIVGGIGVANMMYYLVRERMKETGLNMALGAEPKDVLKSYLLESVILVGFGGLLGLMLVGITIVITHWISLPQWLGQPTLNLPLVLIISGLVALTGIISGWFPARKAAYVLPVEALTARA